MTKPDDNIKALTKKEIIIDIKKILFSEPYIEPDCVSIYDIFKVIDYKKKEYKNIIDKYENDFEYLLFSNFNMINDVKFFCFDYCLNTLVLNVEGVTETEKLYLTKENEQLKILNKDVYYDSYEGYADDVLYILGDEISCFYDELYSYKDFFQNTKRVIKPVNSIFTVEISNLYVKIYNETCDNSNKNTFSLYKCSNNYKSECYVNEISNYIDGKEDLLFSKIFVKIDDCPQWSKPLLYEIRQNQLNENNKNSKIIRKIYNNKKHF